MMKMLTYSGMASARLKANKRGYLSLAIGVFLSIFLITTFVFGVYGIVNAQLHNRQEKVGIVDMVVLDNEIMNDEKLMELGAFDQLGHAYVTGSVEGSSLHLGYYDTVGIELLCLSPTAGRLPENPGEIALEPSALEVLELERLQLVHHRPVPDPPAVRRLPDPADQDHAEDEQLRHHRQERRSG